MREVEDLGDGWTIGTNDIWEREWGLRFRGHLQAWANPTTALTIVPGALPSPEHLVRLTELADGAWRERGYT